MLFLILVAAWAIFLVPSFVRNRSESRPGSSVVSFKQGLDVLGRAAPGSSLPRMRPPMASTTGTVPTRARAMARKRRRDVLFVLGGVAAFTFLLALAFGGSMILLHLAADAALGGYVYLLVQMRKAAVERANTVRYLAAPRQSQPSLVMVRRSASG